MSGYGITRGKEYQTLGGAIYEDCSAPKYRIRNDFGHEATYFAIDFVDVPGQVMVTLTQEELGLVLNGLGTVVSDYSSSTDDPKTKAYSDLESKLSALRA